MWVATLGANSSMSWWDEEFPGVRARSGRGLESGAVSDERLWMLILRPPEWSTLLWSASASRGWTCSSKLLSLIFYPLHQLKWVHLVYVSFQQWHGHGQSIPKEWKKSELICTNLIPSVLILELKFLKFFYDILSCASPGFTEIIICGFPCLLSIYGLLVSGPQLGPIYLMPLMNMIKCIVLSLPCWLVLYP